MCEIQTVFAIMEASEADMRLLQAAVANLARQSAAEPGCLRYYAYLSVKEPTRLIVHEMWANEEALLHHSGSVHVAQFKASITIPPQWYGQARSMHFHNKLIDSQYLSN